MGDEGYQQPGWGCCSVGGPRGETSEDGLAVPKIITARTKILVLCHVFSAYSLTVKAQLDPLVRGISDPRHYCHHVVVDESSHSEKNF